MLRVRLSAYRIRPLLPLGLLLWLPLTPKARKACGWWAIKTADTGRGLVPSFYIRVKIFAQIHVGVFKQKYLVAFVYAYSQD